MFSFAHCLDLVFCNDSSVMGFFIGWNLSIHTWHIMSTLPIRVSCNVLCLVIEISETLWWLYIVFETSTFVIIFASIWQIICIQPYHYGIIYRFRYSPNVKYNTDVMRWLGDFLFCFYMVIKRLRTVYSILITNLTKFLPYFTEI